MKELRKKILSFTENIPKLSSMATVEETTTANWLEDELKSTKTV
jgi:hypothetical protein